MFVIICYVHTISAQTLHIKSRLQTSNINRTLVSNKTDHPDVVGASPVGAAETTSSSSTQHVRLILEAW